MSKDRNNVFDLSSLREALASASSNNNASASKTTSGVLAGKWRNLDDNTSRCLCFLQQIQLEGKTYKQLVKKSFVSFIWDKYPELQELKCQCQQKKCGKSVKRNGTAAERQQMHGAHVVNEKGNIVIVPLISACNTAKTKLPEFCLPNNAPYVVLDCCCYEVKDYWMKKRQKVCDCNGKKVCFCVDKHDKVCTCSQSISTVATRKK